VRWYARRGKNPVLLSAEKCLLQLLQGQCLKMPSSEPDSRLQRPIWHTLRQILLPQVCNLDEDQNNKSKSLFHMLTRGVGGLKIIVADVLLSTNGDSIRPLYKILFHLLRTY
jgi:hypothetical protein